MTRFSFDDEAERIAGQLHAAAVAAGMRLSGDLRVGATDAAELLDVHPDSMRRWRNAGEGPAVVLLAGRITYRLADLASYLVSARVTAAEFGMAPQTRANPCTDVQTGDDSPGTLRA